MLRDFACFSAALLTLLPAVRTAAALPLPLLPPLPLAPRVACLACCLPVPACCRMQHMFPLLPAPPAPLHIQIQQHFCCLL